MTAGAERERELSPLDMARNLAASVQRAARRIEADEVSAYINHTGEHGHAAAELAGHLALVSIAEDLHRVVGIMTGRPDPEPDPWTLRGAVDDARATREHMRRWSEGDETHPGEQP
jgi:hypothetical protein